MDAVRQLHPTRRSLPRQQRSWSVQLAEDYCATCPVVLACLTAGRASRASGLWGGAVLVDGRLAPQMEHVTGDVAAALATRVARLVDCSGGSWVGLVDELCAALAELPGSPTPLESSTTWLGRALSGAGDALAAAGVEIDRSGRRAIALHRVTDAAAGGGHSTGLPAVS